MHQRSLCQPLIDKLGVQVASILLSPLPLLPILWHVRQGRLKWGNRLEYTAFDFDPKPVEFGSVIEIGPAGQYRLSETDYYHLFRLKLVCRIRLWLLYGGQGWNASTGICLG